MNITNLYSVTAASTRTESSSARQGISTSDSADRPRLRIVRDRVVISVRARELLDEMRQTPDIDLSIRTLLGSALLTDERADEVLGRIHDGYYNQPGVLREVATVLSGALESDL